MKIVVSMGQGVSKVNNIENRAVHLQKDFRGMQYALAGAFNILSQTSDQLSQRIPEVEMRRTGRIERNKDFEARRMQQATMRTHCHKEMHTAGSPVKIAQRNTTGVELLRSRVEGYKDSNNMSSSMPPSVDRSSLVPSGKASRVLDDY